MRKKQEDPVVFPLALFNQEFSFDGSFRFASCGQGGVQVGGWGRDSYNPKKIIPPTSYPLHLIFPGEKPRHFALFFPLL